MNTDKKRFFEDKNDPVYHVYPVLIILTNLCSSVDNLSFFKLFRRAEQNKFSRFD